VILLWVVANKKGYRSPYWLTFKQAGELKGKIRKGEKATGIVYAATAICVLIEVCPRMHGGLGF
jgi:antirestriction protein ArdC